MSVNVSQNVQAIRKKLGFSEEQVSTYLGVTRSVLRNMKVIQIVFLLMFLIN